RGDPKTPSSRWNLIELERGVWPDMGGDRPVLVLLGDPDLDPRPAFLCGQAENTASDRGAAFQAELDLAGGHVRGLDLAREHGESGLARPDLRLSQRREPQLERSVGQGPCRGVGARQDLCPLDWLAVRS